MQTVRRIVWMLFLLLIVTTVVVTGYRSINLSAAAAPAGIEFPPKSGTYLVLPSRVVDGDTVDFYWLVPDRGRLLGINAPEPRGRTRKQGKAATRFLVENMDKIPVRVDVHGYGKYGRALIVLYDSKGRNLNDVMVEAGHAKKPSHD